jgi:hypothetical protein
MDDRIFQAMVKLDVRFAAGTQLHTSLETVYILVFSCMMEGVGLLSFATCYGLLLFSCRFLAVSGSVTVELRGMQTCES